MGWRAEVRRWSDRRRDVGRIPRPLHKSVENSYTRPTGPPSRLCSDPACPLGCFLVNVEALAADYHDLVVTACEWRAMGLADPHQMAADVFAMLDERKDHTLRDLYQAIDKVVQAAYRN